MYNPQDPKYSYQQVPNQNVDVYGNPVPQQQNMQLDAYGNPIGYGQPQQQPMYGQTVQPSDPYANPLMAGMGAPPMGQPVQQPVVQPPQNQTDKYGRPLDAYGNVISRGQQDPSMYPPGHALYQGPPVNPQIESPPSPRRNQNRGGGGISLFEKGPDVSDHMHFVRKVYSILAIQLTVTALFILVVKMSDSFTYFMIRNQWISITCCVLNIVFLFMIVCCFRRQSPHNYILLAGFTLTEAWLVGGFTAGIDKNTVLVAGAGTALVSIALTIYAMRTKTSIEFFYAITFVIYIAMLPIMILGLFVMNKKIYVLYCCLGLLFYSIFLIIDTMQICKGKSFGGYSLDFDEYIIGALMLYIDIVMIFVYLLRILNAARN